MHCHVHSSIIYNSQAMETTQVSTGRWVDKEDVVYIYTAEYYWATKKNWGHYGKWSQTKKDKYCVISHICRI